MKTKSKLTKQHQEQLQRDLLFIAMLPETYTRKLQEFIQGYDGNKVAEVFDSSLPKDEVDFLILVKKLAKESYDRIAKQFPKQ